MIIFSQLQYCYMLHKDSVIHRVRKRRSDAYSFCECDNNKAFLLLSVTLIIVAFRRELHRDNKVFCLTNLLYIKSFFSLCLSGNLRIG